MAAISAQYFLIRIIESQLKQKKNNKPNTKKPYFINPTNTNSLFSGPNLYPHHPSMSHQLSMDTKFSPSSTAYPIPTTISYLAPSSSSSPSSQMTSSPSYQPQSMHQLPMANADVKWSNAMSEHLTPSADLPISSVSPVQQSAQHQNDFSMPFSSSKINLPSPPLQHPHQQHGHYANQSLQQLNRPPNQAFFWH